MEKYHEILPTVRDIVRSWSGRLLNLIVPEDAFDDFVTGGGPYLDRKLNEAPPNAGEWDSLKDV